MTAVASPRPRARIAGALYLFAIVGGIFAQAEVRERLLVAGNPAATAQSILAHEPLFRLGLAVDVLALASYIAITLLLYELLAPVNKTVSALGALFSAVGIAVLAVALLFQLVTVLLLTGPRYLAAFDTNQLDAAALFCMKVHGQGYVFSEIFFGFYCLALGWLIGRSTFMPRAIGFFLALTGVCELINSFANILSPPFANAISDYILLPGLLGEGSLTLWLRFAGVNEARWREAAAAA
jgi:hypothetical protein